MTDYTILVVDYEPKMIESARATLEQAGYKVETASDGIAGIEAFQRIKPALTLIELMLPKKSGLEVCRELRQTEYGKDAPLVITGSRFRSRQYRNDARHTYKADDFIEKPISQETLLSLVEAMITGRQLAAATPVAATAAASAAPDPGQSDASLESEIGDHLDSILGDL
jgi:DNA-binding response OmpR family regulator